MRRSVMALLAVCALAGCGDSPEDEARDAGEDVGETAFTLSTATSPEEAQAALDDLRNEVSGMDTDVRDRVADQIAVQRETLEAAAGDPAALRAAVQEVRAQAASFRNGDDAIANEFWRGVQDGYEND